MTMIEKINEGIKESMRSRDQVRLSVMRMLKSKILAVDARANLPDKEVIKLSKHIMVACKKLLIRRKVLIVS